MVCSAHLIWQGKLSAYGQLYCMISPPRPSLYILSTVGLLRVLMNLELSTGHKYCCTAVSRECCESTPSFHSDLSAVQGCSTRHCCSALAQILRGPVRWEGCAQSCLRILISGHCHWPHHTCLPLPGDCRESRQNIYPEILP